MDFAGKIIYEFRTVIEYDERHHHCFPYIYKVTIAQPDAGYLHMRELYNRNYRVLPPQETRRVLSMEDFEGLRQQIHEQLAENFNRKKFQMVFFLVCDGVLKTFKHSEFIIYVIQKELAILRKVEKMQQENRKQLVLSPLILAMLPFI